MKLLMVVLVLVLIGYCTCGRWRFRGNRKHKSHKSKSHKSIKSHGSSSKEGLVECEPLDAPVNGSLQLINGETHVGTVAIYSCDEGSVLSGNITRLCQKVYGPASSSSDSSHSHSHRRVIGAEWSGDEPTCEPLLECEPLDAPVNGSLQLINDESC
ncbi:unnamed protein product, partial [Owenia fusiformis]